MQTVNRKYKDLFLKNARYYILMGGRGAGRSTVASQFAVAKIRADEYFRCAIMRYILSDIRNSIFQDINDRIEEHELSDIAVKEHSLSFEHGENKIQGIGFRKSSGDQKSKLKSLANYNCVIIEEADEVSEEDFMQLDDSLRTLKSDIAVILLLNPPSKDHWVIRKWFNLVDADAEGFYLPTLKEKHKKDTVFIHTTYKDNRVNLNTTTIENFENYLNVRPEHYWNMIKGLVSEGARGRIYKNWQVIPDVEYEELPYDKFYGLDFGFTNDPTALLEVKVHNNKVWFRELIYERGLTNKEISRRMDTLGVDRDLPIYADSAEPKSIRELQDEGWNALPAEKGKDSVKAGIDTLLEKQVFYTESSENIASESQNYRWSLDRNKLPTNKPVDKDNHLMDGGRYAVFTHLRERFIGFV